MSFTDLSIWLIETLFTIYLIILWLRILLPSTHTDKDNSVSRKVMQFTDFLVKPVAKLVPRQSKIDWATLIVLFLLELIQLYLVGFLQTLTLLDIAAVCLWAVAQLAYLLIYIFIGAIILEVIFNCLSFLRQRYYAIQDVLVHLTNPILKPIQSVIPPIGPLDVSPILGFLLLYGLERYLVGPVVEYAILWAFNSSLGMI